MFFRSLVCAGLLAVMAPAYSQTLDPRPRPGALHPPINYAEIDRQIAINMEKLGLERPQLQDPEQLRASFDRLVFPVRASANAEIYQVHLMSNFVDRNLATAGQLQDWSCGTRTYDTITGYNHAGIDISLAAFRGHSMTEGWGEVIAAAPGVIINRGDGAADRNCLGLHASPAANFVTVLQDDGVTAYYWHLSRGTLTEKPIGQRVEAGEYLGEVGSSGLSGAPHLHFELRHPDIPDFVVDAYAGTCGEATTLWQHQPDYIDTRITAVFAHDAAPVIPPSFCDSEIPNIRDVILPGARMYMGLYASDTQAGTTARLSLRDPSGNEVSSQDFEPQPAFAVREEYLAVYQMPEDAQTGGWVIRAEHGNEVRESAFYVGELPDDTGRIVTAVLPSSRSVTSGQPATVFATVLNPSSAAARGCWIAPAAPLAAGFNYRETDPATNAVTGDRNAVFDIAPGSSRSFILEVTPRAEAVSTALDLGFRFKCDFIDAADIRSGINTLVLSFEPTPTPDLIAIAVTPSSDGILRLADSSAGSAFATAVSNVGAEGELTVRPSGTGLANSLRLRLCETDPATGACLAAPAESLTRTFASNETASFAVFARGLGEAVAFSPAANRIRLTATDSEGVTRGSTSVAVRTD
ncbi:peptidoglycan DD-metalloendopeptidase family protein [Hyphobacterium sp.]|uniref:M23 family metallopeptidase n=1 Tax=Hyphobacterium sp. TaxID=2004662 RepID=UPI003BACD953